MNIAQKATNIASQVDRVKNNAAREYLLTEIYRMKQEGKLSSTNAKKLYIDYLPKLISGEKGIPVEYITKWMEKEDFAWLDS